ncbi:molecular chaperone DnaK (HSP70) [Allocatelliglobosispora scoriae]|uniref:Molecular chaperone DnaK (HSP70) n=1 Tax=Allocatelliglobosispora scoriae TaxID=643052 RepID=A0A841C206_9ACTN|nr:Hsp70 family protein [Allocatelliglobosispora scoriae]MBB5873173.1 molecular chaperone DnaK (HSP70) [Allocatelliglobosispora scoriae]
MSDAFGIDFGTTNSVLARTTATSVEAIPLDEPPAAWAEAGFDRVLPSVIGFNGSTPTFGWLAKRSSSNRLEAVKRLFATDDTVTIGGNELKVEEAAAIFFRHIQQRAAAMGLTSRLDRAVVTIPANSRGLARYRTKLSAGLAGIQVMALINEPTAAAMAHARAIGQNQRILVFDWGGGTLDVTVLQSFEGTFIEQSSKGIQRLGGLDVDAAFLSSVLSRIPGSADWGTDDLNLFRLELELAKIKLSTLTSVPVALPGSKQGFVDVTRAQFEEAIRPLIQRTREPLDVCLRESPGRIDHLVMVGGSSKMPVIQKFITDIVGTDLSTDVDPMTAIAEGAAIAAGILQGTITDLDFHVGTEHALGTIVHNDTSPKAGEFAVLIRRNTKYPASATDSYVPAMDFQEKISIDVIEGDPTKPIEHEDNVVIKNWSIDLPEQRLKQDAAFDITYEYDLDGILHVRLQDKRSGKIMMDEELAFGAGEDRSQLPAMRRRVDGLMDSPTGASGLGAPTGPALSPAARESIRKAREKIMPFVVDADKQRLADLIAALEAAPGAEAEPLEALDRELRNHSYLL